MLDPIRICGPDPPPAAGPWTRDLVMRWKVATYRADRRETHEGRPSTLHRAGAWCELYLPATHPRRGEARTYLMTRVWASANGESFEAVCRTRGWSHATAWRWSCWALDQIVAGLNEDATRAAVNIP